MRTTDLTFTELRTHEFHHEEFIAFTSRDDQGNFLYEPWVRSAIYMNRHCGPNIRERAIFETHPGPLSSVAIRQDTPARVIEHALRFDPRVGQQPRLAALSNPTVNWELVAELESGFGWLEHMAIAGNATCSPERLYALAQWYACRGDSPIRPERMRHDVLRRMFENKDKKKLADEASGNGSPE